MRITAFVSLALVGFLTLCASALGGPSKTARNVGVWSDVSELRPAGPAVGQAAPEADAGRQVAKNFRLLGHNDLGAEDTNGDVWAHGNFAYVGTWGDPCNGRGVKVIDVSDLREPSLVGTVASRSGTSAEDVVVRGVRTASFAGDLLAVGIQSCAAEPPPPEEEFGAEFWDVSDPTAPQKLSEIGVTHGGGGVHELDLFQRGDRVYALLATPFSEWFDPVPVGDFQIVDVTNPRTPVRVAAWGAGAHSLSPGPFFGQGSFGARYAHSARASEDGTKAYVSYWDLGVLTFDITDIGNPVLISRTRYRPDADGDAHSVSEFGEFLLQNDEDFDPRSPAVIRYAETGRGIANESPAAAALWLQPGHELTAEVVRASGQGCDAGDYPADTAGKIVVVATPGPPEFETPPGPAPLCSQRQQQESAAAAGAAAVVHDFIAFATSPQWFGELAEVDIPVLYTDHATAWGIVTDGEATLRAGRPSWGFLRVFDKASGRQVARFDRAPNVDAFPPPNGDWSIHNNEVAGDRSYASWYSNGVVALDLRPLDRKRPRDPVKVGQFVPPGAPSRSEFVRSGVAEVWGVAVAERDRGTVLFLSDMNSGLWIVKPTGPAAP